MMMLFGGFAATTNGAPRGEHPMRGIMATKCRGHFLNPRLREVEQEIRAAAYRLRQETKVGSAEYLRLSDAIKGKCSLATLALMCELDAKIGARVLCGAIGRVTGAVEPGSAPRHSNPSDND